MKLTSHLECMMVLGAISKTCKLLLLFINSGVKINQACFLHQPLLPPIYLPTLLHKEKWIQLWLVVVLPDYWTLNDWPALFLDLNLHVGQDNEHEKHFNLRLCSLRFGWKFPKVPCVPTFTHFYPKKWRLIRSEFIFFLIWQFFYILHILRSEQLDDR
jgi:hypothetical protein